MYIKKSGSLVTHIQLGDLLASKCGVKFQDDFKTLKHKEFVAGNLCKKCESLHWTDQAYSLGRRNNESK